MLVRALQATLREHRVLFAWLRTQTRAALRNERGEKAKRVRRTAVRAAFQACLRLLAADVCSARAEADDAAVIGNARRERRTFFFFFSSLHDVRRTLCRLYAA